MAEIDIRPRGEYDFNGFRDEAGDPFIVITLPDPDGITVNAIFDQASFISFADHLTMIAEAVLAGRFPPSE